MRRATLRSAAALAALACLAGGAPAAQGADPTAVRAPGGRLGSDDVLAEVGIDQHLGERVPLDVELVGEDGAPLRLGDCFGERPVVLALVYYECPMLCGLVLNDMLRCFRALELDVGRDFDVVAVSIDPGESHELAAAKRASVVESYGRPGAEAGWRFLTGDASAIDALADAVGFRYLYDAEIDEYAHAAGIMLLTPDGVLSRYFYGLEYPPRDVRLGLVEASEGRIGSLVDQILLFCYHYDPQTGKYGLVITNVVRLAGALTVLAIVAFITVSLRRERRRARRRTRASRTAEAPA